MKITIRSKRLAACLGALAAPLSANAHHAMDSALPGNLLQGFVSGLAHPVIGLDHLLFVIAVGAACYYFGRRTGPVAVFVGGALTGTGLHLYGATLVFAEVWAALSLIALGLLFFAGGALLKRHAGLVFFGLAGAAHGYAYGESIVGAEATPLIAYLAGFTLVQLAVIVAAFAAARYLDRIKPSFRGAHALGGILSIAGAAFLASSFI
jgi:urease accessory protein